MYEIHIVIFSPSDSSDYSTDQNPSNRGSSGDSQDSSSPYLQASPSPPLTVEEDIFCHYARFFIIKSINQRNIDISVQRGIWATNPTIERVLSKSFKVSYCYHHP